MKRKKAGGSLWRVPWKNLTDTVQWQVLGQPEKLLGDVVQFASGTAVTADDILWAWGRGRPAMLDGRTVDREDPYDPEDCEAAVPIMKGVRWAENSGNSTLVIREDGSLWELPLMRTFRKEMEESTLLREPRKLPEQTLAAGDPPQWPEQAPAPAVLPAASLEAWKAQETAEAEPAAPETQPEPGPLQEDTAPQSNSAADLATVAASTGTLALIGWLENPKH